VEPTNRSGAERMGSAELCLNDDITARAARRAPGHAGGRQDEKTAAHNGVLIKGITSAGHVFRPSDWAQRMAAAATVNCGYCGGRGEGRYNPHVRVLYVDGLTCLWVDTVLQEIDAPLHMFIMRFASDNHLKVVEA